MKLTKNESRTAILIASMQTVILVTLLVLSAGATKASVIAYMITGRGDQNFGTINLSTGVYTNIGSTSGVQLSGLGVYDGALYGESDFFPSGSSLYQVDPATGALTNIPTSGSNPDFAVTGSTTTGIYAIDLTGTLFSIDTTTGATTSIGSTGITIDCCFTLGLSTGADTLYYNYDTNIYSINTSTGQATLLGNTGLTNGISAMVFTDGTLYGVESGPLPGPFSIVTVDLGTGTATEVATLTGTNFNPWGLAPIPEPSTLTLAGLGTLGVALFGRRSGRRAR